MLNKLPIRVRLSVLCILLLSLCCVGLTAVLNLSAGRMANTLEATLLTPAHTVAPGALSEATAPAADTLPLVPLATAHTAKIQFFQSSIFYMLMIVALGGCLTYFLSGKALMPLQELSRQMKSRTVHNLSETLPVPESRDEIAALTMAFNQMSEQLEGSFAMQRRFSQSAAHELRTPLTVLKTKVEVFRKRDSHSLEEYDKLLAAITAQTNRLADLVQDLLGLTNMDALDCNEPVEVKELLSEVITELSALADKRTVDLVLTGEPRSILGSRSLLHRAFYNLVENAIHYNVEGGRIAITLTPAGEGCKVSVADTGIGVPPELETLIFEPFYRVDKSRSRQMGGAGLGLTTVRAIVKQHGGSITVAQNPGGGSVFTVVL